VIQQQLSGMTPALRISMSAENQMPATTAVPWPLQTHLELAALPSAVSCARGHVRLVACEWGLPDLAETAELLASELITNAVQASDRLRMRADVAAVPVVRLLLVSDKSSLVIHVWDGNDEMPVRRVAAIDEESGRGLMLVESLGSDWGAYRKTTGKTVWVKIDPVNNWQETKYDRSR
jgi:anti-sigma regulatory factor (Ser/Thr protein kinase)